MILIFLEFCDILSMLIIKKSANILFLIITPTTVDSNSCIEWCLLFIVRINYPKGLKKSSSVSGYSNALLCCVFSLRSTEKGADYGK